MFILTSPLHAGRRLIAALLFSMPAAVLPMAAEAGIPVLDGPWRMVATQPDVGALATPKQQAVDFAIWQAADGTWQIWSCIRNTLAGGDGGKTRLFHRWEGQSLDDPAWRAMGVAMEADPTLGERPGGLQAPYVFKRAGTYHMFYGCWDEIARATSPDGKTFTRVVRDGRSGLFREPGDDANTRDPMIIEIDGVFYCYYVASPGDRGAIYVRTSRDLDNWSESKIVCAGGTPGDGPWSAECPFVVRRGDDYYLLRTQKYGRNALTHVYRSKDPMDFGVNDDRCLVTSLPVAAPEVIEHHGEYLLAGLGLELEGIRLAPLAWRRPAAVPTQAIE